MKDITTEEEARKFVIGEYDEEALAYLRSFKRNLANNEYKHILKCLHSIVAHLFGLYPAGDFGQAILRNDLIGSASLADDINRDNLYLYAMFLANKVPADRLRKVKEWL